MSKKFVTYLICLVAVPFVVISGSVLFKDRQYAWITLCIAVLACVPFFVSFEKGKSGAKEMIIIAVMIAIAVAGRIVCAPFPGFKPVTAVIVITAMYMGKEAGFITGALSAVISNFYFGQGPWTPFQMFVWGFIGFVAGMLASPLKRSRMLLFIYAVLSGIVFSFLMDIWTVLWWDGVFNVKRYIAAIISAVPFTCIYAVSNVVFIFALNKPVGSKLERIKIKYGL